TDHRDCSGVFEGSGRRDWRGRETHACCLLTKATPGGVLYSVAIGRKTGSWHSRRLRKRAATFSGGLLPISPPSRADVRDQCEAPVVPECRISLECIRRLSPCACCGVLKRR